MSAMLRSRWVFSITLAASATLMLGARWIPAWMMRPYASATRSSVAASCPETTFVMRGRVCSRSPGLMRSGEYASWKSTPARRPGRPLERGPADVLGDAGVDRRLVDDHRSSPEDRPDHLRGSDECRQVGPIVIVDRGGYRHHEERAVGQVLWRRGEAERRLAQGGLVHLPRPVPPLLELTYAAVVDVEPDGAIEVAGELDGDRQADVPEPDDSDAFDSRHAPPSASTG